MKNIQIIYINNVLSNCIKAYCSQYQENGFIIYIYYAIKILMIRLYYHLW